MNEKIKNIFTNKIFLMALVFIGILLNFSSCFATINDDFTFSFNNTEYTIVVDSSILENNSYYFYSFRDDGNGNPTGSFVCSNEPLIATLSTNSNEEHKHYKITTTGQLKSYPLASYNYSSSPTPHFNITSLNSSNSITLGFFGEDDTTYISNQEVIATNGDLVFHQAPARGETQGIQALTLEQVEEIPQAMTQTLQVVIPVGLVVFGIGLVIFLMRYLILRLT